MSCCNACPMHMRYTASSTSRSRPPWMASWWSTTPRASALPKWNRPSKAPGSRSNALKLAPPADPELVPCTDHLPAVHHDLQHLLALEVAIQLVLQSRHNLFRLRVDDLAARRIHRPPIDAERDPARQIAHLDIGHLLGRHHRGVEHVDVIVGTVRHPQFLLVRRQRDPMARAAVAFHRTVFESLNLHAGQLLAGLDVADLEAQQSIHADKAE